ncbi:MAG: hypothetical protein IJ061_01505 [Lachnospiraceae bacterium]|nr:hypothetical protein [Lachnospiraceae bacterium]
MKNLNWCIYTYKHRKAFEYTARKLIKDPEALGEMLRRARVHDLDKVFLYVFLDDQIVSQKIHVKRKKHHLENQEPKSRMDLMETVIDYECAPYTKPDKPLNAWDFVRKMDGLGYLDAELAGQLYGIMHEHGSDASRDLREDREGRAYLASFGEVTEEMVLAELMDFIHEIPEEEYRTLCRIVRENR